MIQGRECAAVAVLHGQMYVCGGYDHRYEHTSSVERFDPTHNTWERLVLMRYARSDASAVVIYGRLLICGLGTYDEDDEETDEEDEESDEGDKREWEDMYSAECFVPRTVRWERLQLLQDTMSRPHFAVIPC